MKLLSKRMAEKNEKDKTEKDSSVAEESFTGLSAERVKTRKRKTPVEQFHRDD